MMPNGGITRSGSWARAVVVSMTVGESDLVRRLEVKYTDFVDSASSNNLVEVVNASLCRPIPPASSINIDALDFEQIE